MAKTAKPIDERALRQAFGAYLTGVTVVTCTNSDDEQVGLTANSFTSVSLSPPLVSVCLANTLSCIEVFKTTKNFVINILAEHQQDISNIFATNTGDRFAAIDWHKDAWQMPVLDGVVGHYSCSVFKRIDAGDHVIVIGQVESFATSDAMGLGFHRGNYFSTKLERQAEQITNNTYQVFVGAIITYQNCVLLNKTANGYDLPQVKLPKRANARPVLRQFLVDKRLAASIGSVYSIFENRKQNYAHSYYMVDAFTSEVCDLGEYIHVDELNSLDFVTKAIKEMMMRFVLERKTEVFKLYIGDEASGEIHTV